MLPSISEREPFVPFFEMDDRVRDEITALVQKLFSSAQGKHRVVFSGSERGTGSSSICARAGEILASQVQGSVCLVDCNLRSPSLHRQFGVEEGEGMADLLSHSGSIRQYAHPLSGENFWLISAGLVKDNWPNGIGSDRMRSRFEELRASFDYLLIDAPPLNTCNDALVLGGLCDGVVLVLKANASRRETTRKALHQLKAANVPALGAVLNQRKFPIPEAIYKWL